MIDFLAENPLFLLFVVIAAGYPFGRVSIAGVRLGVATTLFAGLAVGAIDDRLKLPDIVYELGLVIFVYTIGLSSGRAFVQSYRQRGKSTTIWALACVTVGAIVAALSAVVFAFEGTEAAGLLAGGMTNTPALAGVLDYVSERTSGSELDAMLAEPVVAYSIAYPVAVLGTIGAIAFFSAFWKVDWSEETRKAGRAGFAGTGGSIVSRTVELTNPDVGGLAAGDVSRNSAWHVLFGRLQREDATSIITGSTILQCGDRVTLIGAEEDVANAVDFLGQLVTEPLELSRATLDYRRIFVSDPTLAGRQIRELNLPGRYGAIVTRVRRGDLEFLANGNTVLEMGDRVRVVANRDQMNDVSAFFGDSYRALSEFDILTFSLGIALGLGLGAIPFPLPGGIEFKLGIAGGPLVVALLLGTLERTGRLTWTVPYSANLTLRQFGLILFLAGIGTRAGFAFRETIGTGQGAAFLVSGVVLSVTVSVVAIWTARRLLDMPMGIAIGMLAGLQTQPAVLSFAQEISDDELPNTGYAMVFPVAMIAKIIAAQVLLLVLL